MKLNRDALIRLRHVLAELYPRQEDSERVVFDAKLNARRIRFDSQADANWFAILKQADAEAKLEALLEVARHDFPSCEPLLAAALGSGDPESASQGKAIERHLGEAERSLFLGEARGAAIESARAVEAGLKELLDLSPDAPIALGELIKQAVRRKQSAAAPLADDLEEFDNRMSQPPESSPVQSVDEAAEALRTAARILLRLGLVDAAQLSEIQGRAARTASRPPLPDVLRLDRSEQRVGLENLICEPRRVFAFLAHGEVQQGHRYFTSYAAWRLGSQIKGRWRERDIRWPPNGPSLAIRFGELLEAFADAVGAPAEILRPLHDLDPMSPEHKDAWDRGLKPLHRLLAASEAHWLLRHAVHCPDPDDEALVVSYMQRVWAPVAAGRCVGLFALAFEVARTEPVGIPLVSRAWRVSRRERQAALRIVEAFSAALSRGDFRAVSLPELGPIAEADLVAWLCAERRLPRDRAEQQAREILVLTRGRFDLIVHRVETTAAFKDPGTGAL